MSDNNNLNPKNSSHGPNHSLSPSSLFNQIVVSTRRPSTRSTGGSSSSNSRARSTANGRSSIQMEPGLQSLLAAEGRAAEMIAIARAKRNELMQQANQESQAEIDAFRQERELQYRLKLHEATQLERFQAKLDTERLLLLEQMEKNVRQKRTSLVKYIIHCVIDQIPVIPHPNTRRIIS